MIVGSLVLHRVRPTLIASQGTARAASSGDPQIDERKFAGIQPLVQAAIDEKKLPGAVILLGRGDRVLFQQAIGHRALEPAPEPMTLDTIFDLASLTKVVATTTSMMILVEQGKIRMSDRVSAYIPGFERYGKENITVRHLMTHVSGLRPDVDLADMWSGSDTAINLAIEEVPASLPGERFVYSDINYFLLGDIVRRVSGMPLDRFAETQIFAPLGMKDTSFTPPESLRPRIAPTERCTPLGWPCEGPNMSMLRGIVHDPTARRMAGVAGHAGLFSTAADLSTFCRMLLGGGAFQGARILAPLTVAKMTTAVSPAADRNVRGLGWDMDSSYSSNRGELLPLGSFGHTGFTGTSLWIDPATGMFVVFLSNRVHPDGKGDVTPLRARVGRGLGAHGPAVRPAPHGGPHGKRFWTVRFRACAGRARPDARGYRRAARVRLRGASREARGPGDEPHGTRQGWLDDDRSASRREGHDAREALQPRARDPRHP
jgi:CubicO group peptidase (beta-lactamase class C family)